MYWQPQAQNASAHAHPHPRLQLYPAKHAATTWTVFRSTAETSSAPGHSHIGSTAWQAQVQGDVAAAEGGPPGREEAGSIDPIVSRGRPLWHLVVGHVSKTVRTNSNGGAHRGLFGRQRIKEWRIVRCGDDAERCVSPLSSKCMYVYDQHWAVPEMSVRNAILALTCHPGTGIDHDEAGHICQPARHECLDRGFPAVVLVSLSLD